MLAATTAVTFIFAALLAALILPGTSNAVTLPEPPSNAATQPETDLDRPNPDFTAMFKAFLDMGNAIFGNWVPEKVVEDFIRNRDRMYED